MPIRIDPATGAALTPQQSEWQPREFPRGGDPDKLKAFQIVNDWAHAVQEWELRVAAMCAIVEATFNVPDPTFHEVQRRIKEKTGHSRAEIKQLLDQARGGGGGGGGGGKPVLTFPSDIVGHPPDGPFVDPVDPNR
jgi:hypothetical protein